MVMQPPLAPPAITPMSPMAGAPGITMGAPSPFQQAPMDPNAQQTYLTENKVKTYAAMDPSLWTRRNNRLVRHRRMYELMKPAKNRLKPGQTPSVTTDAKAIVHKFSGMFANHSPKINCVAEDPQNVVAAERCSDYLRSWRRKEIKAYSKGPHGPRAYDEAIYAVRDGVICDLISVDPEDKATWPYRSELLDPLTVFPTYDGEEASRFTIKYRTTQAEARKIAGRYGAQDKLGFGSGTGLGDTLPVEVVKVICQEEGVWEIGVMIRGQVITLQKLGYCPVVITYVNARVYATSTQGSDLGNFDRYEMVGAGVFDVIEEAIRNKNEDYTIMREAMKRDFNPPRIIFTDDEGKLDDLKFEPGQNVHLWADDKFQLVQLTPDFRKIEALMTLDQTSIDRGTVPAGIWGDGRTDSSAAEFMMLGNARDQLYVFQNALERHYEAKYNLVLSLYKQFSPQLYPQTQLPPGTPGVDTFTTRDPSTGIKLGGQAFSVQDVLALGPDPDVSVEFSDITPQNEVARSQIAVNTVREKLLDLHTARELLPAPFNEQPELIQQRVLQDITLQHPMMTQVMALTAALSAPNPVMRTLAGMMLPGIMQQAQQAAQPPGMGGPGGGANPTPGQNGVPPRAGQMNPEANPAESGVNNGLPEGQTAAPPLGSDMR